MRADACTARKRDTLFHARSVLDRDGRLAVSVPETVKASADELAPALAAT